MLFERFFLACDFSPFYILTYRMKSLPRSPFIVSPYSRLVSTLLRDRNLTLRGCPERRKPSTYGVPLSKKGQIRYSCPHAQYSALQFLFQEIFNRLEYAPLPSLYLYKGIHSFGESLSPVTSSAQKKVSPEGEVDPRAVTRSLKDGCFQAYLWAVRLSPLPST